MKYDEYAFTGDRKFAIGKVKPEDTSKIDGKEKGSLLLAKNKEKISELQNALYAQGTQSLLIILQAMDAAGKDGTIKHVFTGVNPQGVEVHNFKAPSTEELDHDIFWRIHKKTPSRGMIGIFNRSHYEDVLIGKVLNLPKHQSIPSYALENIWEKRYRQIRNFERMLHENGTHIMKIYLHLSKGEQTKRFVARTEDPSKNWKFSKGDIITSERWDDYMAAYEEAINETAASHAPWYVVPADKKWYARAVVSQIVRDTLKNINPKYPKATEEQLRDMEEFKKEM